MKNIALKYFFIFIFPLFLLFSCSSKQPKVDYPIHTDSERISVDTSAFRREYENGDEVDFSTLKVTFDDQVLIYSENVNEDNSHFYVVNDPDSPSVVLMNHSLASSSKETSSTDIYVAVLWRDSDGASYFISEPIELTIVNHNALKPWVLFTVSGIVILAIAGVSFSMGKKKKASIGKSDVGMKDHVPSETKIMKKDSEGKNPDEVDSKAMNGDDTEM